MSIQISQEKFSFKWKGKSSETNSESGKMQKNVILYILPSFPDYKSHLFTRKFTRKNGVRLILDMRLPVKSCVDLNVMHGYDLMRRGMVRCPFIYIRKHFEAKWWRSELATQLIVEWDLSSGKSDIESDNMWLLQPTQQYVFCRVVVVFAERGERMHVCVCVCVCARACVSVCVCLCLCVQAPQQWWSIRSAL